MRKPTMAKRHFELLADVMRQTKPPCLGMTGPELEQAEAQWERTLAELTRALRTTNPAFNRDRFLAACGA